MLMSTRTRTRSSASPAIASRAGATAGFRGDCCPCISSYSTRSRSCSSGRSSASSSVPACPIGNRTPLAPTRRAACSWGTRKSKRSCNGRRSVGEVKSSRLAPTMLTRPPWAARESRSPSTSASCGAGKDRHRSPGSSSIVFVTEPAIPVTMSWAVLRAAVISGVQLNELAPRVQPAGNSGAIGCLPIYAC